MESWGFYFYCTSFSYCSTSNRCSTFLSCFCSNERSSTQTGNSGVDFYRSIGQLDRSVHWIQRTLSPHSCHYSIYYGFSSFNSQLNFCDWNTSLCSSYSGFTFHLSDRTTYFRLLVSFLFSSVYLTGESYGGLSWEDCYTTAFDCYTRSQVTV